MTADADPHKIDSEHWWTISVTAMSEAESITAAREIQERFPHVYADAVDPKAFMTVHLDRWTARLLRDGLQCLASTGRDCRAMLEIFDSWLDQADSEPSD